jgi:release factor glutamine methyltransferase
LKGWIEKGWDGGRSGRKIIDRFLIEVEKFLKKKGRILMVQSTLSNVEKTIQKLSKKGFSVKVLEKKDFDFETLVCFEAFKQ